MVSLLERKKLQWAQERAEMESLQCPWGLPPPAYNMKLSESRSRFASSLEIRTTCPTSTQQDLLPRRQRSPSLPPIFKSHGLMESAGDMVDCLERKEQNGDNKKDIKIYYDEIEGETSGYGSETSPELNWKLKQKLKNELAMQNNNIECQCERNNMETKARNPITAWQYERNSEIGDRQRGHDHSEGEGEGRPKWGDKGVAVGRLWEPHECGERLPQAMSKSTPSWVERGLSTIDNNPEPQYLLMEHMSSTSSMESYDTKSGNFGDRFTYLLGQNVPIESGIKAERESRRLKALELQAAIVQQLEERALKKKAEKERRLREDMEEEERFKKQKDLEILRLQEERKLAEEKQQREQKRAEALRKALEKAEQQAKIEKENKKLKNLKNKANSDSLVPVSPKNEITKPLSANIEKESKIIQNIFIEQAFSPRRSIISDKDLFETRPQNVSTETNIIMSNPQSAKFTRSLENNNSLFDETKKYEQSSNNIQLQSNNNVPIINNNLMTDSHVSLVPMPIAHEVFTPMHIAHNGGMQMAFLMPQPVYQCMHPVNVQPLYPTETHLQFRNMFSGTVQTDTDENNSNRVLTPSKYRNPNSKDVCTQTDFEEIKEQNKFDEIKGDNFVTELNSERNSGEEKCVLNKKEKETEDKLKEIETRPKWGVNKPPTQYKKQSEKDVFYSQKRKLRTKKRVQEKQYTSHSSDENTSPSPQEINKCSYTQVEKNQSKNYWRKSLTRPDKLFSGRSSSVSVETTEISALKYCDKSGVVKVCNNENSIKEEKLLPDSKRITLSQKFMNDKYGNPKIWNQQSQQSDNNSIEQISKSKEELNLKFNREKLPPHRKQSFIESLNKAKIEQSKYYCDSDSTKPAILNQIKTLKDSLKKQQQIWGKYESDANNNINGTKKEFLQLDIE